MCRSAGCRGFWETGRIVGTVGFIVHSLRRPRNVLFDIRIFKDRNFGMACVVRAALGLIFVPLSTIAYATLDRSLTAEAAGLCSLVRTMGSPVGISVCTTLLSRQGQVIWNELGGHVQRFNPAVADYARAMHMSPGDPRLPALIGQQIGQQAAIGAMLDAFVLITWSFMAMLPLVLLLRRSRPRTDPIASVPPE